MKTSFILLLLFAVLGLGLFMSNQYEATHYTDEITQYRCFNANTFPFPYDYIQDKETFEPYQTKSLDNRFGGRRVRWSDTRLTGLPNDIFEHYDCIKEIELRQNFFRTIPKAIDKVSNLRRLNLDDNHLEVLDFSAINLLENNPSLNNISLRENKIERVLGLPNDYIEDLDLRNNKIKAFGVKDNGDEFLPSGDMNLSEIETLDLEGNDLKVFPLVFYRNLPVKYLNLKANRLEGNVFLSGMNRLVNLDISNQKGNGINRLELNKNSCQRLEKITARNSQLKSFRVFGNHYENPLKSIDFGGNNFTRFPDGILNLRQLEYLSLDYNNLRVVNIDREKLNLKTLNLSHNRIRTIQKIHYLRDLRRLDLSFNELKSIPNNIVNLRKLETLDLSNNQIAELDNIPAFVYYHFENCDLSNNNFKGVFELYDEFRETRRLDLSKNDIEIFKLGDGDFELKELNLTDNPNLKIIDVTTFQKAAKLTRIVLSADIKLTKNNLSALKSFAKINHITLVFDD